MESQNLLYNEDKKKRNMERVFVANYVSYKEHTAYSPRSLVNKICIRNNSVFLRHVLKTLVKFL